VNFAVNRFGNRVLLSLSAYGAIQESETGETRTGLTRFSQ
jgi:hypothetical protein